MKKLFFIFPIIIVLLSCDFSSDNNLGLHTESNIMNLRINDSVIYEIDYLGNGTVVFEADDPTIVKFYDNLAVIQKYGFTYIRAYVSENPSIKSPDYPVFANFEHDHKLIQNFSFENNAGYLILKNDGSMELKLNGVYNSGIWYTRNSNLYLEYSSNVIYSFYAKVSDKKYQVSFDNGIGSLIINE